VTQELGPADIEKGRKLFAGEAEFKAGASSLESLPKSRLPEIAFAGRSNVGKSSLINALTGRTRLVRVSHTPGRTREINFFSLGGRLMLVDLPGYGYARAAKTQKRGWNAFVQAYLGTRANLKRVCLLIDARQGAGRFDEGAMKLCDEAAMSFTIVLTKADELRAEAQARALAKAEAEARRHTAGHPHVMLTSARTGAGLAELRAALALLV